DVYSIYCDSRRFAFFWEKLDGLMHRRKLRFRWYSQASDEAFVEIKQRSDRTTQKRRALWPVSRIEDVFVARRDSAADAADPVIAESLVLLHQYGLAPVTSVAYRRQAWSHESPTSQLRVTFDTDVRSHSGQLQIGRGFTAGRRLLRPDLAIME